MISIIKTLSIPTLLVFLAACQGGPSGASSQSISASTDSQSSSSAANLAPLANAGVPVTALVGEQLTLDGSMSVDADNGPTVLTYQWVQVSGPSVTIINAAAATATFTPIAAGSYTFQLTVFDGEASASESVTYTVDESPSRGIVIPGRVEAEDYSDYHDTTAGNEGGEYRQDDVDIQTVTDADGGYGIGWTRAGEWLSYEVDVASDDRFQLTLRMASNVAGPKTVDLHVDGTFAASFTLHEIAGWQAWRDVTVRGVALEAGAHTLALHLREGSVNINYLDVKPSSDDDAALSGAPLLPPRAITLEQHGPTATLPRAQRRAFDHTPLQATGYYAYAGDVLTFTYQYSGSAPDRAPKVVVHDITNEQGKYDSETFTSLAVGTTTITAERDGIIYYSVDNTPTNGLLQVSLASGGYPMPRFVYQQHNQADWLAMLSDYAHAPWVELISETALVNATMASAQAHVDDPHRLMGYYDWIIPAAHDQYGIKAGNAYPHAPTSHRYHFVELSPDTGYYMFSWYYRMTASPKAIPAYLNSIKISTDGWGMWHELGHQLQIRDFTWSGQTEVTVNLTSAYIQRLLGLPSRFETAGDYDTVFNYFNQTQKEFDSLGLFARAIMFWQLQLTFGDEFYRRVGKNYRDSQERPSTSEEKIQRFILETSRVAGYDLSPFFTMWGLAPSAATTSALASMNLTLLTDPIWQNRDTDVRYPLTL